MTQYHITLNGHTFDVKVLDDPRREEVRVEVDGELFTVGVEVVSPATGLAMAAPPAALPQVSGLAESPETLEALEVSAPLPGVIKSIAVRPGQRVAADDELVVIEAMKMDNVIRAPRGGTVGTVHVVEGRQVAYGELLVEMTSEQMTSDK